MLYSVACIDICRTWPCVTWRRYRCKFLFFSFWNSRQTFFFCNFFHPHSAAIYVRRYISPGTNIKRMTWNSHIDQISSPFLWVRVSDWIKLLYYNFPIRLIYRNIYRIKHKKKLESGIVWIIQNLRSLFMVTVSAPTIKVARDFCWLSGKFKFGGFFYSGLFMRCLSKKKQTRADSLIRCMLALYRRLKTFVSVSTFAPARFRIPPGWLRAVRLILFGHPHKRKNSHLHSISARTYVYTEYSITLYCIWFRMRLFILPSREFVAVILEHLIWDL